MAARKFVEGVNAIGLFDLINAIVSSVCDLKWLIRKNAVHAADLCIPAAQWIKIVLPSL